MVKKKCQILWHKLLKWEFASPPEKQREKSKREGHLVSIKKIKWLTLSRLLAALLLGGVRAPLSIIIQLTQH